MTRKLEITVHMTIAGKQAKTEETFNVINPSTEEILAKCPAATVEQLNKAVAAAKNAFSTWSADEKLRRKILKKCGEAIEKHQKELALILTQEQGKPYENALSEVKDAANRFKRAAQMEIPIEILQDDEEARVEVHRKPLGVIAAITPWNYPISMGAKIAMPLVLGNTVILKPSPYTPLSTLKMGELLRDLLPPGVANFIAGDDQLGAMLTKHPDINKISFTGSVATGKKIAAVAANNLKRITLELGGNDPAIVLADIDPKKIAEDIFWSAFTNNGQMCIATKRLYVHENIFEPLLNELIKIAENVKVGDGLEKHVQLGPLNNKQQLKKITQLVADAKKHGAKIATGGKRLKRPGYFYSPTLVTHIKEGVRLVDQEQFGPVLPVMKFKDIEEVIKRANATEMGLGASVWTKDWKMGQEIAKRLESGTAWVNRAFTTHKEAPFGGMKSSGLGREGGRWSVDAYTEPQTVSIAKN